MNSRTIGIVGGSGFLGASLAEHLSASFRVKVFDQKPLPEDLREKVDFQQCDIRDYHDLREKINNLDLVILTAIVQIPLINEDKRLGYEVNVVGAKNVCEVVNQSKSIKGLILTGTWHVLIKSKEEERAKFYKLTKLAQETLLKIYDEMSDKTYAMLRLGTVLGEKMHEKTAVKIFLKQGLDGNPITPYKHSMHRPMFCVDIKDVCKGFGSFARKILSDDKVGKEDSSTPHVLELVYPKPFTILDLATMVREAITKESRGKVTPRIEIVDKNLPSPFTVQDKESMNMDVQKTQKLLGIKNVTSPKESIRRIVARRMLAKKNSTRCR